MLDVFLRAMYDCRATSIVWFDQYGREDVEPRLLKRRPLLLEPSNPFNNVCQEFSDEQLGELQGFARESLVQLERVRGQGVGPLFSAQFSRTRLDAIGRALGQFKDAIDRSWLVYTVSDRSVIMARAGFPYVIDNLKGNYSLDQVTDLLTRTVAVQGFLSLAFGNDVQKGTEDLSITDRFGVP